MKINSKPEVLGKLVRRTPVLAALLAVVFSLAAISNAQSSATTASVQDAKPAGIRVAQAQTTAAVAKPASAQANSPASPEEKPPVKGAKEGINVHGHWTIEVKNPDGTVAARQEFENALDPFEGADLLTGLLSGEYAADGFLVDLSVGNPVLTGLNGSICGGADCLLYDSRVTGLCAVFSPQSSCGTLTYTANTGTANKNAIGFTLSGNVTLNKNDSGTIILVGAGIVSCFPTLSYSGNILNPPVSAYPVVTSYGTTRSTGVTNAAAGTSFIAVPPGQISTTGAACSPTAYGNALQANNLLLTSRTISQPVTGGQSVAVTVVISFSGS